MNPMRALSEITPNPQSNSMRKDLDDSELKPEDEQVHEEWQKRGLSRGKLRKHVMKMMDWDNIPEVAIDEILSQIREKVDS